MSTKRSIVIALVGSVVFFQLGLAHAKDGRQELAQHARFLMEGFSHVAQAPNDQGRMNYLKTALAVTKDAVAKYKGPKGPSETRLLNTLQRISARIPLERALKDKQTLRNNVYQLAYTYSFDQLQKRQAARGFPLGKNTANALSLAAGKYANTRLKKAGLPARPAPRRAR